MTHFRALQVLAERCSRKGCQKHVFRFYNLQLQMGLPELSKVGLYFLNDTNAIFDRHLQIQQHHAYRFYSACKTALYRFLDHCFSAVDCLLAVCCKRGVLQHIVFFKEARYSLNVKSLVICNNNPVQSLIRSRLKQGA